MPACLTFGIVLRRPAGLSPGPLSAPVASQAMRHGADEGMTGGGTPLPADAPFILLSVPVPARILAHKTVPGGMLPLGKAVFARRAQEGMRATGHEITKGDRGASRSPAKGVPVNFLRRHPGLSRLTAGGPAVLRGWKRSRFSSLSPDDQRSLDTSQNIDREAL